MSETLRKPPKTDLLIVPQEQESGDAPDVGQGPQTLCHSRQVRDEGVSEAHAWRVRHSRDKGRVQCGWHGMHAYMLGCMKKGAGHRRDAWRGPDACRGGPEPRE